MFSFVRKDLEILKSAHEVEAEFNYREAVQNLWKNYRGIRRADIVFYWFGSLHFLPSVILAKLLRKKIVVVSGGYEVVDLPNIAYGNMRGGLKAFFVRYILGLADRIISVSESNRRETIENAGIDPSKIDMVYHGFDPGHELAAPKEDLVITVGMVSWTNLKRKGLEDFVRVAKHFPEVPFKLIGRWADDSYKFLEKIAPPNVEMLGFIDESALSELLSRAKVYVQASRHEGFGCAVAEAMLHKCIPVVNNVYALPEVVGDCGYLTAAGDEADLMSKIRKALDSDDTPGERARRRIVEKFPLDKRARSLLDIIASV